MSLATGFLHGLAIAIDYGMEMLAFWRVAAPMTISSQSGLALRRGDRHTPLAYIGRALNWMNPGHTDAAIKADIMRAHVALVELGEP